jgi:DNA-binding CsgD family transcriptional regulator
MLQGLSNKVLANRMGITLATLKEHLTHVYRKAEVSNRDELMALLLTFTLRG